MLLYFRAVLQCVEGFRFRVNEVFTLTNRGRFVVGDIEDGVVRVGDVVEVVRGDAVTTAQVDAVEFVDTPHQGLSKVALGFRDLTGDVPWGTIVRAPLRGA